jgi:3-phosphoshikimate 1-carboxyvinyltransferase
MSDVRLDPISKAFVSTFAPPGSKSLTNRALVLAALAEGACELFDILLADDTHVMIDGLRALGFELDLDESRRSVRVSGHGGKIERDHAEIFCGNSGTTIRFLTALCALGRGTFTLDGVPRMRQRPIAALTGMLQNLGVRSEHSPEAEGFPPVRVLADGLPGGIVRYGSEISSQYLSAVLMVAPYARNEVIVMLDGRQTSWPYVAMTMQLMDTFGVTPELIRDPTTREPRRIIIPPGRYAPTNYKVEPDASNASYFLALAALHEGARVTIDGLGTSSLQGDVAFAQVLGRMGANVLMEKDSITVTGPKVLEGIDVDLSDMPDVAQTLAVVAIFAAGRTTIRGLHTLRVKETDRLAALQNELQKLGAAVEIKDDALIIDPPEAAQRAEIDTYDDHRMAMSFALAGTKVHGIVIKGAECVNKTYPGYFGDLKTVVASDAKRP